MTITEDWMCVDEDWFPLLPAKDVVDLAEDLAAKHADTAQARTFLTRSILSLNKEAVNRSSSRLVGWVPDRQTGEVRVFGFTNGVTSRASGQAAAEAYIAQKPARFAAASNFKVVGPATAIYQCPAGPTAFVGSAQRQRRTTTVFTVAQTVTFPEVEGLNEGSSITLLNLRPDDEDLARETGKFVRMMANSLAVRIRRDDGSTFTVGPWGESD